MAKIRPIYQRKGILVIVDSRGNLGQFGNFPKGHFDWVWIWKNRFEIIIYNPQIQFHEKKFLEK